MSLVQWTLDPILTLSEVFDGPTPIKNRTLNCWPILLGKRTKKSNTTYTKNLTIFFHTCLFVKLASFDWFSLITDITFLPITNNLHINNVKFFVSLNFMVQQNQPWSTFIFNVLNINEELEPLWLLSISKPGIFWRLENYIQGVFG